MNLARRTGVTLCSVLVGLVTAVSPGATSLERQPNIIFVLCDDLGYGDVGVFYQNQRAALQNRHVPFFMTPNLDEMARQGMRLTQHYCAAPVCAPSRASLLTGLTQGHANVRDNQFDKALADTHTLGTVLRQAGYATAAIGKWGLQGNPPAGTETDLVNHAPGNTLPAAWTAYPTGRGFDFFYGYVRHKDGHFHYPKEDHREVWENDHEVSGGLDLCYTTDLFTARAKQWIVDQQKEKRPFFLYLAYDTPHAVLVNPPCAYPAGGGVHGGVQWLGKPGEMINTAHGVKDGWVHPDYAHATWDDDNNPATPEVPWPDIQKRHANAVRRIDDSVGDLLQLLKDLKIDESTMVVFTSDNGPAIESYLPEQYEPTFFRGFGPFDGIKRDTFEGGEREPTIVRWPGAIAAGGIDAHPSGQWDWLATLAQFAGVPAPAASDGVSLVPSLLGKRGQRDSTLYVEYFHHGETPNFKAFAPPNRNRRREQMQTIYLDSYKGLRYDVQSADDDFEIYDLAKDPQEAHNLGKDPRFTALQTRMKARVLQVRQPDASAKRPYDNAFVPAVAEPNTAPGLTCLRFAGDWPWMPQFFTLPPTGTEVAKQVSVALLQGDKPQGLAFEGYVQIPHDGRYTFKLDSDTGAMLFLHDIRVIDEPIHNRSAPLTGSVRLATGWHSIRLYYRHEGSTPHLNLQCQTETGEKLAMDEAHLRQAKTENGP